MFVYVLRARALPYHWRAPPCFAVSYVLFKLPGHASCLPICLCRSRYVCVKLRVGRTLQVVIIVFCHVYVDDAILVKLEDNE